MSGATVTRWVADRRLVRIHVAVYAFGHVALIRDGWWHAASLATGPESTITARAGCEIWKLLPARHGPIDVISTRRKGTTTSGIRVHRTVLAPDEATIRRGLRVTSVARAIVDLSDRGSAHDVASALDQTLLLGLFDRREFDRAIARAHGRRGLKVLLPAMVRLSDHGETFLSRTERRVRDGILAADLPRPVVNHRIPRVDGMGYRVDLLWPQARLVVEIDGPQHRMPYQQELDRERDEWLAGAGYRVLRIPVDEIDHRWEAVIAQLTVALRASSK